MMGSAEVRMNRAPARRSAAAQLTITETKLLSRDPGAFFTLVIPVFILIAFGSSVSAGDVTLLPMTLAISVALVALYLMPTALATYREKGILRRLSTTPVRPGIILVVQLALQVAMAWGAGILLILGAMVLYGAQIPADAPALLGVYALGTLAVFSLGLVIAAVAPSGRAANGIGVLLYFPLAYLAGLLQPTPLMPATMVRIGEFTPLGAFRSVLHDVWTTQPLEPAPLVLMAAYAVVLTLVAVKLFRWE
ncbi:ABC-2 type transport system permease protein [Microbacterium kyungheense]|uniref:Transport permease protein n=2 Tax=Microbacterium kyungheense TaxID=1263636 RepID=A0A543FKJ5_9MICO|nr:ABC-2 type transport system permease protein [Microbacterium kyungheense]